MKKEKNKKKKKKKKKEKTSTVSVHHSGDHKHTQIRVPSVPSLGTSSVAPRRILTRVLHQGRSKVEDHSSGKSPFQPPALPIHPWWAWSPPKIPFQHKRTREPFEERQDSTTGSSSREFRRILGFLTSVLISQHWYARAVYVTSVYISLPIDRCCTPSFVAPRARIRCTDSSPSFSWLLPSSIRNSLESQIEKREKLEM